MNHFFRNIVGLVLSRNTDAKHLDYNRDLLGKSIILALPFSLNCLKQNELIYAFF